MKILIWQNYRGVKVYCVETIQQIFHIADLVITETVVCSWAPPVIRVAFEGQITALRNDITKSEIHLRAVLINLIKNYLADINATAHASFDTFEFSQIVY